jgi:predicted ATPase
MQLKHLRIARFRNLRDLKIEFDTHLPPPEYAPAERPKPIRSHAIIGQNGAGKSNLIEALITIFRNIDLNLEAPFDYTLEYSIRGRTVRVEADKNRQSRPYVLVDGKVESQAYLHQNRELLPSHIFAYYSGRNERIEALFQEHQRRFNRRQEIVAEEVLPAGLLETSSGTEADIRAIEAAKRHRERQVQRLGDDRLRRLFYCRGGHSQLVLLACLLSDDPVFRKVLSNLNIESLESALFVLKEPYHLREKRRAAKFEEADINEGDPRFWYARGNVVTEFLDKLWQVAWAPIEQEVSKQIDFRGRSEKQRQLYLFVPSHEKLKALGEMVGTEDSFFRYAEGAYIGDLIEEVRIIVKKREEHGGKVAFTQLSEGELQMLTVLGLMRITREDHCLFLLDEPDTHLNPLWKLRYFDDIESVLQPRLDGTVAGESQVIVTTHDPLMIGGFGREQVRILRNEHGETTVEEPAEHPQGMGVAGLLKSEVFGLPSTLDAATLRLLDERNELVAKRAKHGLSADEEATLARLRAHLDDLGFSREHRDPLYQLFLQKMYDAKRMPLAELLTESELAAQEAVAEKVAKEFVKKERQAELAAIAKHLTEPLES